MLLSYKLLQINYYTLILNMYVLILYGRDYTISELFGFFHRLMLALLPIYLSTKFFVDAYQIFFWKRHTKTRQGGGGWVVEIMILMKTQSSNFNSTSDFTLGVVKIQYLY